MHGQPTGSRSVFDGAAVSDDVPVPSRGGRKPLDIDAAVAVLVNAGMNQRAIARALRVSQPTVGRRVNRLGLREKVKGGRPPAVKDRIAQAKAAIMAGERDADIAARLGYSKHTVNTYRQQMKRAGEPVPSRRVSRRDLFNLRWSGRVLVPRKWVRRRIIASRAAYLQGEWNIVDREMARGLDELAGTSIPETMAKVLRLGSVDGRGDDDWRLAAMRTEIRP